MRAMIVLVALLICLPANVRAADDVAAAQSTIRSQVEAIGRDDATDAYGYASPVIQEMFSPAETFMGMVRRSYAPIYRHKSFEFGEARTADGKIMQQVHIIDADGEAWEAMYTVEQERDGSLKISGCVLMKAGQAV